MPDLRKQLEALIEAKSYPVAAENDYLEGVICERGEWFVAIRAILASPGEQAPGLRVSVLDNWACDIGMEDVLPVGWQAGLLSRIRFAQALDTASPAPSPAPDAGLREKVAQYFVSRYNHQPNCPDCYEEADGILRLCGEGQLREALAKTFEDVKYSEITWDDAYDEIEKLINDPSSALQRTPEPPSREMERKAFVEGAEWNDMLVQPSGCEGFYAQAEAEAARRFGGET